MAFKNKDLKQIQNKGLTEEKVNEQIELFKSGLPFSNLVEAATIDNGILRLSEAEETKAIEKFEADKNSLDIVKFVPASGAATRMFKFLFKFLD